MAWAIIYQPRINEWRYHPTVFASREAARFAADNWPDLLNFNFKRVVQVAANFPRFETGKRLPVQHDDAGGTPAGA